MNPNPQIQPAKFFIGIPTFQRPALLDRALKSILKQEYTNFEIIVVDDTGEENRHIHDSPYLNDSRVHYFAHKKNLGVNQARNNLVIKANELDPEAFIVFIDDDDCLVENALSIAAKAISEHPDYAWFTMDCVSPDGSPISRLKHYGEFSYLKDYMFGKNMRGDMMHIVKAKAIGNIRFSDRFKNGEEWYFFSHLSINNKLYAIKANGKVSEYLDDGISKSGGNQDQLVDLLKYKIETLEPIVGFAKMKHQYVSLIKHLLKANRKSEAGILLRRVFRHTPGYLRQYTYWIKYFYC